MGTDTDNANIKILSKYTAIIPQIKVIKLAMIVTRHSKLTHFVAATISLSNSSTLNPEIF